LVSVKVIGELNVFLPIFGQVMFGAQHHLTGPMLLFFFSQVYVLL